MNQKNNAICIILLQASKGARNPNLQVATMHEQHLLYVANIVWSSTKMNGMHRSNLITLIWTFYHS